MNIELTGELSEAELISAQWLHIKPRRSFRIVGIALLIAFALALSLQVVAAVRGSGTWFTAILGATAASTLLLYAAWYRWWVRRLYRRQASLHGEQRSRATDDHLEGSSLHGSGITKWSAFIRWRENDRLILLYPSDAVFYVFPKRWLHAADLPEFTGFLTQTIGEPGR